MQPEADHIVTGAVVVLTGDNNRVQEGLRVFGNSRTQYLLVSGVNQNVNETQIRRMWTDPNPLKPCCIVIGYNAGNTVENAREVTGWVKEKGFPSIRLVTSNYHMKRAELEISHLLPSLKILRHPVSSPDDSFTNARFLKLNLSEYNKYILRFISILAGQDKFK